MDNALCSTKTKLRRKPTHSALEAGVLCARLFMSLVAKSAIKSLCLGLECQFVGIAATP
jgi:hypothetical protein